MWTKAGAQESGTTRFEGFAAEAFDFYEALADNNNRTWCTWFLYRKNNH